jgi:hypothetical protein
MRDHEGMRRLAPITDPVVVAKALYGDGAWEITKAASLSAEDRRKKNEKLQAQVGLASNVVGLGAGIAATPGAVAAVGPAFRAARGKTSTPSTTKMRRVVRSAKAGNKGAKAGLKTLKTLRNKKVVAGLVAGNAALQVANVGGDAVANRVLSRASKDGTKKIKKSMGTDAKVKVLRKVEEKAPKVKIARNKGKDFTISATVSKAIEDKRQVYGWASITEMDGQPVVDLQGDYTTIEEIEKAAHKYISKSRKGGDMHVRVGDDPKHVSDLIESIVITPEKKEALGLPPESPTGWWVGMQVHDDETWQLVKDGKRPMFSVHGSGRRVEMEIPA